MHPSRGAMQVHAPGFVEVVAMNKRVVHDHGVGPPGGAPAPATPTVPAIAEEIAHRNRRVESEIQAAHHDGIRRPIPARIGIVLRRSPDPDRVVLRHVHHVRVHRVDIDRALVVSHLLLRRGSQLAGLLRLLPQGLHRIHHVLLLRQKSVAQVGGPIHVGVELLQHVGKHDQRLYAGVPVLLLDRGSEHGTGETWVLLQPLPGFDHFERIGGGGHYLAEQRIRVQRNGRHQILQLIRRQTLVRRRRHRLLSRQRCQQAQHE